MDVWERRFFRRCRLRGHRGGLRGGGDGDFVGIGGFCLGLSFSQDDAWSVGAGGKSVSCRTSRVCGRLVLLLLLELSRFGLSLLLLLVAVVEVDHFGKGCPLTQWTCFLVELILLVIDQWCSWVHQKLRKESLCFEVRRGTI